MEWVQISKSGSQNPRPKEFFRIQRLLHTLTIAKESLIEWHNFRSFFAMPWIWITLGNWDISYDLNRRYLQSAVEFPGVERWSRNQPLRFREITDRAKLLTKESTRCIRDNNRNSRVGSSDSKEPVTSWPPNSHSISSIQVLLIEPLEKGIHLLHSRSNSVPVSTSSTSRRL